MDSKRDLKDTGLDEQAVSFRKVYETEDMDSLIRQFDAWIGDTERLIEDAAQWRPWRSEYD